MNNQSIEGRFAYYTEANLATLEMLKGRKSSSQADIRRQRGICEGMVAVCQDLPGMRQFLIQAPLPRLREMIG